jgi:NAD(P)-dependent dehydrogenase (short-subunit alcohol dehydrogenase family)
MDLPGIAGKVAIVTGGARGIGRAYALGLARAGADVVVADVLTDAGAETAGLIQDAGAKARFVYTDVTDEASAQELVAETVQAFGGLDILVNNAAVYGGLTFQHFTEIPVQLWDRVYAVNVRGVWLCAKAAAPAMRQRGGGVIVNQSSTGAYSAGPMLAHYTSSKSAVVGLTKTFAKELADWGIRVNAIAPGVIHTQASLDMGTGKGLEATVNSQLLKRPGVEEDLVGPLLFLVSDASAFMTGQVIVADGGRILLG